MNKNYLIGSILIGLILLIPISLVLAQPGKERIPAETSGGDTVIVPPHAVEIAEGIFSLGQAKDIDGKVVEGFMIIDKKKGYAKPPWAGGGGGTTPCFSVFATGARWKTTENYTTEAGVDIVVTETSLNTWDSEVSFDIFGARNVSGITDGADDVSPDGKNEVMLENLGPTDTIAYTLVWGTFYGKPSGRKLVEWDTVFNTAYTFGNYDSGDPTMMDYQNIATHEFGHALGLAHPDDTCTEETMYRFADFNETKKRTLEAGDIAGVNELY